MQTQPQVLIAFLLSASLLLAGGAAKPSNETETATAETQEITEEQTAATEETATQAQ